MKHHKEWAKELRRAASVAPTGTLVMIEPWLRQVQLDAMKEGMQRAAKECNNNDRLVIGSAVSTRNSLQQAILRAAEQLTEKDLV